MGICERVWEQRESRCRVTWARAAVHAIDHHGIIGTYGISVGGRACPVSNPADRIAGATGGMLEQLNHSWTGLGWGRNKEDNSVVISGQLHPVYIADLASSEHGQVRDKGHDVIAHEAHVHCVISFWSAQAEPGCEQGRAHDGGGQSGSLSRHGISLAAHEVDAAQHARVPAFSQRRKFQDVVQQADTGQSGRGNRV